MSLGNSVGDVASSATFCWKVYKKCQHSSGEFKGFAVEVGHLHCVLKENNEIISHDNLSDDQQTKLKLLKDMVLDSLNELEGRLGKHKSLDTQSKRELDKMGWLMEEGVTELRQKLVSQTTLLDTFNNR
jgi:hypothetical protein